MAALVQSVSATGTVTPLPLTLPSASTPGNCLVACIGGSGTSGNPTVSGITLGGAAGNFAQALTEGVPSTASESLYIWSDWNCGGGQTAVSIAFSAFTGSVDATVMEFSGLFNTNPVDQTAGQDNDAGVTSWTSTGTSATSQPVEVAVGCVVGYNASGIGTITGPTSPWNLLTQVTSASTHFGLLAGYQLLSASAAVTYAGSFAASSNYAAGVVTFKTAPLLARPRGIQAVRRAAYY